MALPQSYTQVTTPSRSRISGIPAASLKDVSNKRPSITNSVGEPPKKTLKNTIDQKSLTADAPKGPEKPLMPYQRYSRKIWDQVKSENPNKQIWEIGRIIGQMWRELSKEARKEYCKEYEIEKTEYEKKVKIFEKSPVYLAYLAARSETLKDSSQDRPTIPKQSATNLKLEIYPAEDDEDVEDHVSARQIAFARYARNHRLLCDIFSDSIVPDARHIVTANRLQVLRRQVQSLTIHQKKLESELQAMQDKFDLKKKNIMISSQKFKEELEKCVQSFRSQLNDVTEHQ